MASVLLLHQLRLSRRGAPVIFSTLVKGSVGWLEQHKQGRGYSDKVQNKTEGRPRQGCAAAQEVMDR